jgi:hypothetical protein
LIKLGILNELTIQTLSTFMFKNNLVITISAVLILVLSIGGYLLYSNSQKTPQNSKNNSQNMVSKSKNSSKPQTEFIKKNETNDIKINETGTINPNFQSSETKEKYGVDFDPCKMLTPELTEKYFGFKFENIKTIPLEKGSISCKYYSRGKLHISK